MPRPPPDLARASVPVMPPPAFTPGRPRAAHPEPLDGEPLNCESIDRMAAGALRTLDLLFPEIPAHG